MRFNTWSETNRDREALPVSVSSSLFDISELFPVLSRTALIRGTHDGVNNLLRSIEERLCRSRITVAKLCPDFVLERAQLSHAGFKTAVAERCHRRLQRGEQRPLIARLQWRVINEQHRV